MQYNVLNRDSSNHDSVDASSTSSIEMSFHDSLKSQQEEYRSCLQQADDQIVSFDSDLVKNTASIWGCYATITSTLVSSVIVISDCHRLTIGS